MSFTEAQKAKIPLRRTLEVIADEASLAVEDKVSIGALIGQYYQVVLDKWDRTYVDHKNEVRIQLKPLDEVFAKQILEAEEKLVKDLIAHEGLDEQLAKKIAASFSKVVSKAVTFEKSL